MKMNAKQIITLAVGIVALGVTAWKGPGVWSAVSAAVTAIALFVGTLKIVPAKDQEYVDDLEDALRVATTPQNDVTNSGLAGASRERFAKMLAARTVH